MTTADAPPFLHVLQEPGMAAGGFILNGLTSLSIADDCYLWDAEFVSGVSPIVNPFSLPPSSDCEIEAHDL
jgi:hypothetical protein